jgi:putative SOS response-associated peptidase YedK
VRLYRLTLKAPPHNLPPRYNICPTDPVDVVTEREGSRDFVRMRWGLVPSWWPKPLKELKAATFNARVETVAEKPFFREAFRRTRCLIPASGYYEWQDAATGKQPWYFTRADGEPMTFAGLWDEWKDKATGEVLKSCTMLITEPNDFVAEVHDRMPVVLESKHFASWLNDGGPALPKPAANNVLHRWPVSRRVNSSRTPGDDPTNRPSGGDIADRALASASEARGRQWDDAPSTSLYERLDRPRIRRLSAITRESVLLRCQAQKLAGLPLLMGVAPQRDIRPSLVSRNVSSYRLAWRSIVAWNALGRVQVESGSQVRRKDTARMYEQWIFFQLASGLRSPGFGLDREEDVFRKIRARRFLMDLPRGARLSFARSDGARTARLGDIYFHGRRQEAAWSPDVVLTQGDCMKATGAECESTSRFDK